MPGASNLYRYKKLTPARGYTSVLVVATDLRRTRRVWATATATFLLCAGFLTILTT